VRIGLKTNKEAFSENDSSRAAFCLLVRTLPAFLGDDD